MTECAHASFRGKVATFILAFVVAVCCMTALAFADSENYVTVNDDTTQYATLDEAAAAATLVDGTVTYTIHGDVTATEACTGRTTSEASLGVIGGQKATEVNIIGSGEDSSSLTLNGDYAQCLRATGDSESVLNISNLTLEDNRPTDGEGNSNDPWEFTYLMLFAPQVNCTDCTFEEGVMVGGLDTKTTFTSCTFSPEHVSVKRDGTEEPDLWENHYGLWLELYGDTTVDSCDFTNCAYGAIKSLYVTDSLNTDYSRYRSTDSDGNYIPCNINLTVKDTTFEDCGYSGEHRPFHLDGIHSLSVTGCTFTDCWDEDVTDDPTAAKIVDAKSASDDIDAINADYVGDNTFNNTYRYTVEYKYNDETLTTKYFKYAIQDDTTYGDITYNGYHYIAQNPVTEIKGETDYYKDDTAIIVTKGDPISYTVKFDANGGKGTVADETISYDETKALTKNSFTRSGYKFTGWNTEAKGTGTAYADGASVKNLTEEDGATITLYAQWQKLPKPYINCKATAKGKTALKASWTKVAGATGYDIFFSKCSKHLKKVKTTKKLSFTKKGLKKGTTYKFKVRAFKMVNGKKVYITSSKVAHAITGNFNARYSSAKSIKVAKKSVNLSKGKTTKIKASQVKFKKSRKFLKKAHAKVYRYASTDSSVATVSASGKITAKGKGTCKIFVYAQNGKWATVKVTVK
ncbi:MAG: InlB B-repeat-containing protein [Coriobacteriales bacterium]|jgi:uncharacterized repeat protein (TIGR02543 family)